VEWRPSRGFGLSTPKPDDYGSGADEVYDNASTALDRIVHLIETGGETVPPLAVRLAELRQIRGLSQAELAERAGLKQANLSRFENQEDARISTLEKIVTALGASLSITARFPDGSNWELRF
jgi:DNA-binding Xre family transcriptional regulator